MKSGIWNEVRDGMRVEGRLRLPSGLILVVKVGSGGTTSFGRRMRERP